MRLPRVPEVQRVGGIHPVDVADVAKRAVRARDAGVERDESAGLREVAHDLARCGGAIAPYPAVPSSRRLTVVDGVVVDVRTVGVRPAGALAGVEAPATAVDLLWRACRLRRRRGGEERDLQRAGLNDRLAVTAATAHVERLNDGAGTRAPVRAAGEASGPLARRDLARQPPLVLDEALLHGDRVRTGAESVGTAEGERALPRLLDVDEEQSVSARRQERRDLLDAERDRRSSRGGRRVGARRDRSGDRDAHER